MALVTTGPARMAGLADRGSLAPGKRADMVAVVRRGGRPGVRQSWVEGRAVLGLPALQAVR